MDKNVSDSRLFGTNYNHGNHDVYKKEPVFNFEMHNALFMHREDFNPEEYYSDVESILIWDKDAKPECRQHFGRHMSLEDTYIYIISHLYKHFSICGTGLRSLADIYCYNKKFGSQMDREYVEKECQKLGIDDYEKDSRSLALKILNSPQKYDRYTDSLDDNEKELLRLYINSGIYGSMGQRIKNEIDKMADSKGDYSFGNKIKYCTGRMLPSVKWFRNNFEFLDKYPILIPFYAAYRLIFRPIVNSKKIRNELREVSKL
ncbi:MAG: nucleotidyltransferase family protein [Lachnospiraceae bacterium]|nr:nucleotidyltransferase family protein [Lachnospiraceae bacterium]